jgi:hypothetical protein
MTSAAPGSCDRSSCRTSARRPSERTCSAVSAAPSLSVCQVIPTSNPSSASCTAVALPIPESEAVTIATLATVGAFPGRTCPKREVSVPGTYPARAGYVPGQSLSRSSASALQRGSACCSSCVCGSTFRSLPHIGHSPAQSAQHRIYSGSASAIASLAHALRSSLSSSTYGVRNSSLSPGLVAWYSRAFAGMSTTASPRQR